MSGPEIVTISQLSEEILVHIFSFLLPSDRRNCALICRRWAEALGAPALTREIWFHVKGSDMEQAATILHRSYRQYKNLRLSDASLFHFNSSFWTEIGVSLRKLELIECFWSPDVYYDILQECPNLESLTICSSKRLLTRLNFELPPWVTLRRTQDAMRNVHHLHVKFLLNADMLWLLLVPLTNVKTIALSRFDRNSDFLLRLRDIVGENRKITMLDLEMPFLRFDDCERVLEICAPSVQEIRARRDILPREVFEAMRLCTKLRHLTLQMNLELENNSLRRVLQNVPELETLELCDESKLSQITQETLAGVLELTKLRELILRLGRHRGQNARDMTQFLNDLERISTLEHISLDMDGFAVTETAFRSLTNLPKLQTLALHNIKWNGECPKILSTPKHLETLRVTGRTNRRGCYNPALKHTAMMSFRSDLRTRTEMSALVSLKFENLPVTDSDLESITANHDRVRVLFLWNCANVTGVELTRAVQRLPLLEELEVRGRKVIGGEIFDALEKGCHQLKSFRLSYYIGFDRSAAELFKLRRPMVVLGCNGESVDLVLPFIEHSF